MLKKMALKLLLKKWNKSNFSVIFWDGEKVNFGQGNPSFTLKFNQEPSWQLNNDDIVLTLGEAYMDGIIDLEGSMDEVLRVITENSLPEMKNEHTIANKIFEPKIQKQNIHRHYDLGNDFFSLWLDKTMSYSCAYFETQKDTLEQAQLQKIDHTLKKLNLKPNEKLLDIGSGWGWLIIRAAQQYHVKATGITLSTEQYDRTKEQIQALGLENQVKVYLTNYQELDSNKFQFNKIVSVGMFEHVGKGNHNQYMKKIHELLVPGGISLLHTITGMFEEPGNSWMEKYIFPGGYVPSLRETIWTLPEYDFHLLHLESLRLHYALTLDYWYNNFLEHIDEIRQKYGERFVRMWSLYLQGCAAAFRVSGLDVHQLLFTKGLNNELPLTYNFIYNQK